jgi:hypothetical protein
VQAPGPYPVTGPSAGAWAEGQQLGCPFPITPSLLRHLIPGTGQVTDRLGDHQPGVTGHPPQDLPPGIHLPEQADVAGEQQRPRSALAGVAERPLPPAVASRERAPERVLAPSRSPACPGQPGSAHDTRQLRRHLVGGGRAVPSIGRHLARRRPPNRSWRTGSIRPAPGYIDRWHHAKCPRKAAENAHRPAVLYWNGPLQSGPLKARRTVCSVAPVSNECAAKYSGVEL